MTLIILIGTEIIPKTIGTVYWRRFAMPVAYYVRTINVALLPVIWVTEKISRMLTRGNQEIGFNRHEFWHLPIKGKA